MNLPRTVRKPTDLPVGKAGFTLIELLIVIAIIGILISIGLASFSRAQKSARDGQRKADLKNIAGALEQYYSDENEYPDVATWQGDLTGSSGGRVYLREIPKNPTTNSAYDSNNYKLSTNNQIYCLVVDLENDPDSNTTCPADSNTYEFVVSSLD